MRWFVRTALLFGCIVFGGCNKGPTAWQDYSSAKGGFSIQLPTGTVEETEAFSDGLTGSVASVKARPGAFIVVHTHLGFTHTYNFSNGIQDIAQEGRGSVKMTRDIDFQGTKGKEYELAMTEPKGTLVGRMFVVNRTLYNLMVGGTKMHLNHPDAQHFFTSFKLNNLPEKGKN